MATNPKVKAAMERGSRVFEPDVLALVMPPSSGRKKSYLRSNMMRAGEEMQKLLKIKVPLSAEVLQSERGLYNPHWIAQTQNHIWKSGTTEQHKIDVVNDKLTYNQKNARNEGLKLLRTYYPPAVAVGQEVKDNHRPARTYCRTSLAQISAIIVFISDPENDVDKLLSRPDASVLFADLHVLELLNVEVIRARHFETSVMRDEVVSDHVVCSICSRLLHNARIDLLDNRGAGVKAAREACHADLVKMMEAEDRMAMSSRMLANASADVPIGQEDAPVTVPDVFDTIENVMALGVGSMNDYNARAAIFPAIEGFVRDVLSCTPRDTTVIHAVLILLTGRILGLRELSEAEADVRVNAWWRSVERVTKGTEAEARWFREGQTV